MFFKKINILLLLLLATGFFMTTEAQKTKWMSAGSLHNWYSELGCEWEEGFVAEQQYGWRWPALYDYQDMQCAKGLWIGTKNFKDVNGKTWDTKVIHTGPRKPVSGSETYPVTFKMRSKFEKPKILVDGVLSERATLSGAIDTVDPNMLWDKEILTVVNTPIGITMTRKIFQFSNQFHDNYIVNECTFTNTGKADPNDLDKVTYPGQTLTDLIFFFQYRLAPCSNTRYEIGGNPTGWGMNTTGDVRGDGMDNGVTNPPDWNKAAENNMRCQFIWHGKYPAFTNYDNIGGPIWTYTTNVDKADTIGRLGAIQFIGTVTLHADKSASDKSDDFNQPFTTTTIASDQAETKKNDMNNEGTCINEYQIMKVGHDKRQLVKIGEKDLILPSKNPAIGEGGTSYGDGYGPYTLKFGESVTIVFAEAANGMNRDRAVELGRKFMKDKDVTAKNKEVMKGKDSLMLTFKRAIANYNSGWKLAELTYPPKEFTIDGLGDRVSLGWTPYNNDANINGYSIYRAVGRKDSTFNLIAKLPASARSYDDKTVPRGVNAYYSIQPIGKAISPDPSLGIWAGNYAGNMMYTASVDPATLKRQPGNSLDEIRIVPNPFNLSADANTLRFVDQRDRLYFYNIPGNCDIKIYTEYGELIKVIKHINGTGDEPWNCVTSSNQIVVSGIYLAVITDNVKGNSKIMKFVIIR